MHANDIFRKTLEAIKNFGDKKTSRAVYDDGTTANSISIYQQANHYNVATDTCLHNYRPTAIKTGIQEILWIYQDQTNCLKKARERGIYWWEDWNVGDDTIGFAYGRTVRDFDLMNILLHEMQHEPFSRRHILSLWQQGHIQLQKKTKNGLVPCAFMTIWTIDTNYTIHLSLIQRSGDYITANSAINISQYEALGLMVAGHLSYHTGIKHNLKFLFHFTQDTHIYDRHNAALNELLEREPTTELQKIELPVDKDFYDYTINDFVIKRIPIKPIQSPLELAK